MTDVLNQVGGVSLTESKPGVVQIAVRGVLSGSGAGTSTVGYYTDEVPFVFINTAELSRLKCFRPGSNRGLAWTSGNALRPQRPGRRRA